MLKISLSSLRISALLAMSAIISQQAAASIFPYAPSLLASVTWQNDQIFTLNGLAPLFGNQDGFFYGDLDGHYSSGGTYYVAPGVGGRIVNDNQMWGASLFGDFTRTDPRGNFWVISPGVEWASPHFDVHVNGYIPPKNRRSVGGLYFDSQLGIFSHARFNGHNEFDEIVSYSTVIGRGFDTEAGFSFPFQDLWARAYAGNYYFKMPSRLHNVNGVAAGLTMPINRYVALDIHDSYDSYRHNQVGISLQFRFGGNQAFSTDVHTRLQDAMVRHVGMWNMGSGTIAQREIHDTGTASLYRSNIWFFSNSSSVSGSPMGVTQASCTYENPCSSFNQSTVNAINALSPNANIYLGPGSYDMTGTTTDGINAFTLNSGQSIYGRASGYAAPATGTDRPLLNGAVQALGNNTLDSLRISATDQLVTSTDDENIYTGLYIPTTASGSAVTVSNSSISASATDNGVSKTGVVDGIRANGGSLTLSDSSISASNAGTGDSSSQAIGVEMYNDAALTSTDTTYASTASDAGWAIALYTGGTGTANVTGGTITATSALYRATGAYFSSSSVDTLTNVAVTATNGSLSSSDSSVGVYMNSTASVTITGGTVSSAATGGGYAYGLSAFGSSVLTANNVAIQAEGISDWAAGVRAGSSSTVTMTGGSLTAEASGSGTAFGIRSNTSGDVTLSNTTMSAVADTGKAYGIYNYGSGDLGLSDVILSATSSAGETIGFFQYGSGSTTITNGNISATSGGSAQAAAVQTYAGATTLSGTTVTVTSVSGNAYAFDNAGGTIASSGVTVAANSTSGTASIENGVDSNITFSGSNTCTVNGSPEDPDPCA